MINNKNFTNIRVILDDCLQHELLQDLTLEQTIGYVIKFNGIFNIPQLYVDKFSNVPIKEYKGVLYGISKTTYCFSKPNNDGNNKKNHKTT